MNIFKKFISPTKGFNYFFLHSHCRAKSYNVLFFGSDEFSLYSLKLLHESLESSDGVKSINIVTTSKINCVSKFAQLHNLNVIAWPPELKYSQKEYDVGVVVSFGHLIPKRLIDVFPLGMINVHASLLPRWRGASPIIHAILNGDAVTGITIMQINPHHFDTGKIILQRSCSIGADELMPSLHHRLGELGAVYLKSSLTNLSDLIATAVPQSDRHATYAPRIDCSLSIINWKEQTASYIYNLYRALYSLYELKTSWHDCPLKFSKISLMSTDESSSQPGSIDWNRFNKKLIVRCKKGSIVVETLRYGSKSLSAKDFYNGYLSKRKKDEWYFR